MHSATRLNKVTKTYYSTTAITFNLITMSDDIVKYTVGTYILLPCMAVIEIDIIEQLPFNHC